MASEGTARVLAGRQSLILALKLRLGRPGLVTDLNPLPDLSVLRHENDNLSIDTMTHHAEGTRSLMIAWHLPLLTQAVQLGGATGRRIRPTATGTSWAAALRLPAVAIALRATALEAGAC